MAAYVTVACREEGTACRGYSSRLSWARSGHAANLRAGLFVGCDAKTRVARLLYRCQASGPKGPTLEFAAFMIHWVGGARRIAWVGQSVWTVNTMKLDHIAIWAVDIELMRTFYEKYFDAQIDREIRQ